ncbi:PAS domain S-box protein [Aggregatimonas sangjinii]|uniref:histidine kinase n=1 Tax=Aggregatimonas sangjinii TaxID=2583587 RepID=A0A5B7SRV2_9FLAO|nr:chemotaxis protein CheB [Aggregatimonas sangjinii]QCX01287.1 PAS domain S-box protein [Aggregatimonas sangjinii]
MTEKGNASEIPVQQDIFLPETPDIIEDSRIVAIGASAGGLEALKEFFNNVPPDCLHSFVIIQHLSPDYKSLMAELLARNTTLPIYEIKNGMPVEHGCIYLIPPKKNMTLIGNKLMLTNKPKGNDLNLPIDIFFRSLAQECKEKAICIILSGTGSDGTSGSRAIKEAGGMIMVQDPDQAKFDGMPLSAINTGLVDYTLPVEQLPAELIHFIDHPRINGASVSQIEEDEETVNGILRQIRNVTKLDFIHYKRPTLVRRIARRISVNKFHNLKEYLDFILENSKEVHILAREFLIGVTKFFRDTPVWESMASNVIPDIVKSKSANDVFKVWCVGTSTGEEAYSMAILILEELERQGKELEVKVFATDLASSHLEIGSRGIYSESIIANVSKDRLSKYFTRKGDEYQVIDALRRTVIFSQHNVLRDPPFNKMDIAVCRNLLIYMQPIAQKKIIGLLHYSLNLNGILLLGSSETLGDYKSVLQEVDRKLKIFQNIKPAKSLGMEPLNYPDIQKLSPTGSFVKSAAKVESKLAEVMNEVVAEELGLAGVYIDENLNILHAVGAFKKFIELPEKGFSINLLKMLPDNVSVTLGAAVRKALRTKKRVLYKALKIRKEEETIVLDLLVDPFEINSIASGTGCLLLFMPKEEIEGTANVVQELSGLKGARIAELEEELKESAQNLQLVVQEVETSNEELQTTNEELLAANEELQSTNEELQSVNEELHTVNAELQQKIEDLAALNADMDNLLKSTDIGTIFLDKEMRIRKFTPAIREHFNLRDGDINRQIEHFTSNFGDDEGMFENAKRVLEDGQIFQKEVQSKNKNWFLERITPYFDNNDKIDGAVVSFVNINELKESERQIRKSEQEFKALYNNAPDMFASFNLDGYIINCNMRLVNNLGYDDISDVMGLHLSDLYVKEESKTAKKRLKAYKAAGKMVNQERSLRRKDGSLIEVSVNAEILYDKNGEESYSICSLRDITELKEAQKQLVDRNKAFEQLLEGTMAGHWDWLIQEGTEYLSPSFKEMFGYKDEEMENTPEAWQKIIHPDDLPGVFEMFEKHTASKGEVPFDNQVRYYHKDGSIVWVYCRGKVIEWDDKGNAVRMVGSHVDITPLKNIEEELYRSNRELEQFAYVASHDLQEPLNTITDFVGLFEEQYKDKLDSEADQYLEFITQAANRMSSLVKSVLGYSRIGKSKEITTINCNTMVQEVLDDLSKRIKDTGTKLEVGDLPVVKGYRMELNSLFLNLIANAVKFRKEGRTPKVTITAKEEEQFFMFSISDNGIGIEEKNQDRIFNIFQRLNNMDSYEGTGIGLAQCKKIAELHGGNIWVDSVPDKGSTFNFKIKNFDR